MCPVLFYPCTLKDSRADFPSAIQDLLYKYPSSGRVDQAAIPSCRTLTPSTCLRSSISVPVPPADIPSMPLERSYAIADLTDPNIVVGTRKCRPTECLIENGDPLAHKKARKVLKDLENMEKHTALSMPPPTRVAHAMPALPARQTTQSTEGVVDRVPDPAGAIVVADTDDEENGSADEGSTRIVRIDEETTEEDDNTKLGMCPILSIVESSYFDIYMSDPPSLA